MAHGGSESDWKVFRTLREVALDRFCKRVLDGVQRIRTDDSRSHHERYLDLYSWLGERNHEMAVAFDDSRRSTMILQLVAIHRHGLLEPHELARFTLKTRETIESLTAERHR